MPAREAGESGAGDWSREAVDRWADERAALRAAGVPRGRVLSARRVLMPYLVARYRVASRGGAERSGLTAVNAALHPYPDDLGQALSLFKPRLLGMRRTPAEVREAPVVRPSGGDLRRLGEKISWWVSELNDEIGDLSDKLRAASREAKRSLILPGSPSLARADRELKGYLAGLKGRREAFNLLFGLSWGEEARSLELEAVEPIFQRVWVVVPTGLPPVVVESSGRRGARPDEGLNRILSSSEAASEAILSALRSPGE